MQTIWSACVLTKTVSAYIARAVLRAHIYIFIFFCIFEFNVQFISRDHIADVDFNDVSVYMEINWWVGQPCVGLRNKFVLKSICAQKLSNSFSDIYITNIYIYTRFQKRCNFKVYIRYICLLFSHQKGVDRKNNRGPFLQKKITTAAVKPL